MDSQIVQDKLSEELTEFQVINELKDLPFPQLEEVDDFYLPNKSAYVNYCYKQLIRKYDKIYLQTEEAEHETKCCGSMIQLYGDIIKVEDLLYKSESHQELKDLTYQKHSLMKKINE